MCEVKRLRNGKNDIRKEEKHINFNEREREKKKTRVATYLRNSSFPSSFRYTIE